MAAKIVIVGNLTRDPEMKDIGNQKACVFSVAARTRGKNDDGTYKANFYDCTYFGKMGESVFNRAQKGTGVTVWGDLVADAYTSNNEARPSLRVTVESVECMSRIKENGAATTSATPRPRQNVAVTAAPSASDELPF